MIIFELIILGVLVHFYYEWKKFLNDTSSSVDDLEQIRKLIKTSEMLRKENTILKSLLDEAKELIGEDDISKEDIKLGKVRWARCMLSDNCPLKKEAEKEKL